MEERTVLERAVAFAEKTGAFVHPLSGKIPLIKNWVEDSANEEFDIEDQQGWDKADGFGVNCGKSDICVLDIDDVRESEGKMDAWPVGTVQHTSKGYHLLYRSPLFVQKGSTGCPWRGADIRGMGSQIKVWNEDELIESWDRMTAWPLYESVGGTSDDGTDVILDPSTLLGRFEEGSRNHSLMREAGSMVKRTPGVSLDLLNHALQHVNMLRCKPPLTYEEVCGVAVSAMRYSEKDHGNAESLRLWKLSELWTATTPTFLIKGLMPIGGVGMYFGSAGVGKTFVALDHALRLASGMTINERKTVKSPVVYIAMEGDASIHLRVKAAAMNLGLDGDKFPNDTFRLMKSPPSSCFNNPAHAKMLTNEIIKEKLQGAVIYIDTLAASMPGLKENDSGEMQKIFTTCRQIALDCCGSLFFIHHKGKTGTGPRGSSAINGACDLLINVSKTQVKADKVKDGEENFSFSFKLTQLDLPLTDEDNEVLNSACVTYTKIDTGAMGDISLPQKKRLQKIRSLIIEHGTMTPQYLFEHVSEKMVIEHIDKAHPGRVKAQIVELVGLGLLTKVQTDSDTIIGMV